MDLEGEVEVAVAEHLPPGRYSCSTFLQYFPSFLTEQSEKKIG